MALRITIKTDFGSLTTVVERIPEELDRALPEILNNVGDKMSHDAVELLSTKFNLPGAYIEEGLITRTATAMVYTFELSSRQDRFPYVQWITQRDERVCPICGPRDGRIYTKMEVRYIWPAHPNCRCIIQPLSLGDALVEVGQTVVPAAVEEAALKILSVFERGWHK